MRTESNTNYVNGTHYLRLPASIARFLKLDPSKKYTFIFSQDEIYNEKQFILEIKGTAVK